MRNVAIVAAALSLSACVSTQTAMTGPSTAHVEVSAGGLLYQDQALPTFLAKAAEVTAANGKKCFDVTGQKTSDRLEAKPFVYPTRAYSGDIQMRDTCDERSYNVATLLAPK
jgi:hypothetical protein